MTDSSMTTIIDVFSTVFYTGLVPDRFVIKSEMCSQISGTKARIPIIIILLRSCSTRLTNEIEVIFLLCISDLI